MRHGDFVTVAVAGDLGKPRPAVIVASALVDAPPLRLNIEPNAANGLRRASQIMIDKPMTVLRTKLDEPLGRLDGDAMVEVERRLAVFLGIAK